VKSIGRQMAANGRRHMSENMANIGIWRNRPGNG